ncbi:MAG: glyoxalase [Acidobacteria bacterium]|nr:glyoxalase [Acidobacteriota bacterium]
MATSIFVNFPTEDLDRSKNFYTSLGWTINPMFSDQNAACVVVDENVYFMILVRDFFRTFTDKEVIDPHTQVQALTALSCDSRAEVDEVLDKGLAAGGREHKEVQDLGFMYSRDLEDPDGNVLSFMYMDPAAAANGPDVHVGDQA